MKINLLYLIMLICTSFSLKNEVLSATAEGTIGAIITNSLSLEELRRVDFGRITTDNTAGVVGMNDFSVITDCPTGYMCYGNTIGNSAYLVKATPGSTISIELLKTTAKLTKLGGGNTPMNLSVSLPSTIPSNGIVNMQNPMLIFGIGGDLSIPANVEPGSYSTENTGGEGFTILVHY